ncbi:hypothetical protein [Isoptericola dokdonensis]|uniref:Toxin-antitoxin system HicB family antitoxin n=1 Tax=Isoptericola dokdonensis DS-3 TaxID=1300344 RepID=A0A161IJN1_9MICO|nr:hypothetical protein [Isoptericola dokdonensis]ANC32264.1 hypothetical protein I598_2737 [Isoptericola dokdonensis DS-3]
MTDVKHPQPGDEDPSSPGSGVPADEAPPDADVAPARKRPARKQVLLRLDPAIHDALARWAADDLRSVNAQIDMLLREALRDAGRLPRDVRPPRRPGRPPSGT